MNVNIADPSEAFDRALKALDGDMTQRLGSAVPTIADALAGVAAPEGLAISIREIPDRGMIDLRGLASDRKFMAAAKEVLGVDLPKQPRTSVAWGDIKLLWLSIEMTPSTPIWRVTTLRSWSRSWTNSS